MGESTSQLLTKGLEEEVYTGTPEGDVVGMSHLAKAELEGFTTEPDCRNTEFVTPPLRNYDEIGCEILRQRRKLRKWLKKQGDYTLIPGATLSLGDTSKFQPSDRSNPYYRFIEETYGTNVVTTSSHINLGLEDAETILRAVRVVRMEACLFLALVAASPFLDGKATGFHSTRWAIFPHTPKNIPLFATQAEYAAYVERAIVEGAMQNSRHLWVSARPNGLNVPHEVNRVELRICDRVDDPQQLAAVTGLLEARLWQVVGDPTLDPLTQSRLPSSTRADDLLAIAMENDGAVAKSSLNATVRDWHDGRKIPVRQWVERVFSGAMQAATQRGFDGYLEPVRDILDGGNTAQNWLKLHASGMSVRDIVKRAIVRSTEAEAEHRERVC